MTEDARVLSWFSSVTLFGTAVMMTTGVGVNWSLLSLGSGMLVGLRINASMLDIFARYPNFRFEIGVNVNHPIEFWPESVDAIRTLQDAGIHFYF